eukprot:m.44757 g.44757  ORF g.44757 m.44757 type:complete len:96 (+) comp10849_c0_seq9:1928-2215(+)
MTSLELENCEYDILVNDLKCQDAVVEAVLCGEDPMTVAATAEGWGVCESVAYLLTGMDPNVILEYRLWARLYISLHLTVKSVRFDRPSVTCNLAV